MFARVSEVAVPVDHIEAGIDQYKNAVLPAVQAMDGFQRAYLLVDRDSGRSLAITVWDSEESLNASDEAANRLRAQVTDAVSAAAGTASRFEVVVAASAD